MSPRSRTKARATVLGQLTFFDDTEFDADPVALPFADIARGGRSLLIDAQHPSGGEFLSWVE